MGKKFKKKARSSHKEKRVSSSVPEHSNPTVEIENEQVSVVKERKPCNHIDKGVDLVKISSRIGFTGAVKCQDCREGSAGDRKVGKGRGNKQGRKKAMGSADMKSEPKCIWVCLECGHFTCGGPVGDSSPQNHVLRHARHTRHPCAVQFDNPLVSWCFSCNSMISAGKAEDCELNDILSEAQELIKACSSKGAVMDVEDVWFGGNDEQGMKIENGESAVSDARGSVVGGLVNLGNTCFFNAVMQNLLAMNLLRAHFMNLERSVGPLTMALKKLFNETSIESGSKSCINPKALFGCICSKAPQFKGYQQQDSHELLRYLLEGLHTEELGARKTLSSSSEVELVSCSTSGPTFVDVIFGGQISSTVCCVECGHSSIVYEPFLDLSLPVPAKKSQSRKAPVSHPKKTKLSLKEGNKGGNFQEKKNGNVASVSTQSAMEVSLPSECSKSSCMDTFNKPGTVQTVALAEASYSRLDFIGPQIPDTEQTVPLAEANYPWLDYIGPQTVSDNVSSISQNYDTSDIEDSGSTQVFQNENVTQNTREFLNNVCSLNQDTCPEDDLPLCVQDSEVLLLPYKEEISPTEEIKGMRGDSQNPVTAAFKDAPFKDVNATASSINGWEQIEPEFDGFGDLFNEPETVCDIKTKFGSGDSNFQANEEMETALLAGNSSESNQDEIDSTNAQVSIDSCLAYFTKLELLSDEHAWYCESCSKVLRRQMVQARDGKGQAVTRDKRSNSKSIKHQINQDEFIENGKLTSDETSASTFESLNPNMEGLDAASSNAGQKLINHAEESNLAALAFRQSGNERDLEFVNLVSYGLAHSPEIPQTGNDLGESKRASEDISCTSVHDKTSIQGSSGDLYDETIHFSPKDDAFSKVDQGQKKVPHSSVGVNELANSESEEIDLESTKVKRDATKRILISKAPSILTINLKRFIQDARGRLNKLSGHVSFRDTLDLRPYMDPRGREKEEKCRYHLVGAVEHSGTMRGGHYVAYVKGERSRGKTQKEGGSCKWFYASDANVHEVSFTKVLRSEAYILFYEKI